MGFDSRAKAKKYQPVEDDTLETIAEREAAGGNPITWEDLARFNFGTTDKDWIEEHLRDLLGCHKRDPDNRFVITPDMQGELLIPVPFRRSGLATTMTHVLKVRAQPEPPPQFLECAGIDGVNFEFDKSFIRPAVVDSLKTLQEAMDRNPDAKIMIFGHTDKVGPDTYNKSLSERRARSVYAFITNDADAWEALYKEESWGTRAIQELLKDFGDPFDPGPVDGVQGPKTTAAIMKYQEERGLRVDGVAGPDTRRQMFTEYMTSKHDLKLTPGQFMDPKHMGCGEFNPKIPTESRCEANRRVTFFLFHPERLPVLPCVEGSVAPCKKQMKPPSPRFQAPFACSYFDSLAHKCPCEGGGAVVTLCGVTEAVLVAIGGQRSVSHAGTPPVPGDKPELGDFCFAPGAEPVQVAYRIHNPDNLITAASLRVYWHTQAAPLWSRPLTPDEWTHGEHTLDWDGKVATSAAFPDGFVTLEHTPYRLEIAIEAPASARPPRAWTFFHLRVSELSLELGPKEALALDRDRALHATLGGGVPAPGAKLEVKLPSNLFKTNSGEMNDNTAFTQYQAAWGEGPGIPIFAGIRLRASDGSSVVAPLALGRAPFLWDWEDVTEDTSRHHAQARTFLDAALDYDKASTQPPGDNCHRERGGKRGPAAAAVFPAQGGYEPAAALTDKAFPFAVSAAAGRKWAALSLAWTKGALSSKTGVLFQPSRMAGDACKVTVYAAHEKLDSGKLKYDVADAAPLAVYLSASTGTFEAWRETHLVKYIKKTAALPAFSVATFQGYYEKAAMRVLDNSGGAAAMAAANYNAKMAAAVTAAPEPRKFAIDPAANQYASGTYAVHFRAYNAFKAAVQAAKGLSNADLATYLTTNSVETSSKYHKQCKEWAKSFVTTACDGYLAAAQGINVIQFGGLYNLENSPGGIALNGFAADFPSAGRNKCAFVQCASAYGGDSNTMEQTITHEIGHHLFLPHAPFPAADLPGGAQADRHDEAWANCTMSYDYGAERKFCGLCLLRLRGWDATKLSKKAADNRKA